MFYDKYKELCEKKNISLSRAAIEIGFEKSLIPKWKQRGLTPRAETLNKIAAYFGVSVDYLLTGKEKENATIQTDDGTAELIALWGRLPKDKQVLLLSVIRGFLED